jgi:hypothetical protein
MKSLIPTPTHRKARRGGAGDRDTPAVSGARAIGISVTLGSSFMALPVATSIGLASLPRPCNARHVAAVQSPHRDVDLETSDGATPWRICEGLQIHMRALFDPPVGHGLLHCAARIRVPGARHSLAECVQL